MTRKVRKDFNPTKDYSVNVEDCSEDVKKEVQQAFFDVGFQWECGGRTYQRPYAAMYTNMTGDGYLAKHCMFGTITEGCNMTAKEFLDLVYEPEQHGHVHAELMAQYAEDAMTHAEPWKLWQYDTVVGSWTDCARSPSWTTNYEYRRKPKMKLIHGTEVPDLSFTPSTNEDYYYICLSSDQLVKQAYNSNGCMTTKLRAVRGLCYPFTAEGKRAAILHAEALLNID